MALSSSFSGSGSSSAASVANRVSQDINGASNPNWSFSSGSGPSSSAQRFDDFFSKYQAMIKANVAENNAWSAQQAQINRDWQERMSNTAHQREVADLKAAGLNPVLSAMNGNGAATTSGATASTDTSANQALTGLLGSMLSSIVQQENARLSAQVNLAVAEKYNQMSKYTAELSSQTQLTTANISASTSKWIAELQSKTTLSANQASNAASMINAQVQAAAQRYGYELSSWTNQQVAQLNASVNRQLKQMDIDAQYNIQKAQLDYQSMHPSNIWQAGGSVLDKVLGSGTSAKAEADKAYERSGAKSFMEQSALGTLLGWYK
jgi:hypothetical protein